MKKIAKKTVKKAAKKVAKQTVAMPKVIPFTKKNTEALADLIFSDKMGQISCLKLCDGLLSNGKDGGRTLHCAVGEAYFTFVSKDMKKVLKEDDSTDAAIDALIAVAQLKNKNGQESLRRALKSAVESNDDSSSNCMTDLGDFVTRSKEVADTFRKQVAPLLK